LRLESDLRDGCSVVGLLLIICHVYVCGCVNLMLWLSSIFDCGLVCHYSCMLAVNLTDLIVDLSLACHLYLLLFDHSFCSNDVVFLIVYVYRTVCCYFGEEKRAGGRGITATNRYVYAPIHIL
jgi:hypothetical protein